MSLNEKRSSKCHWPKMRSYLRNIALLPFYRLREVFCGFKDHMDVGKLYKNYLEGPFNMTEYLCRYEFFQYAKNYVCKFKVRREKLVTKLNLF